METLKTQIEKHLANCIGSRSFYIEQGNTVIRISNHLPNPDNFRMFNSSVEKIVLIFTSNEYNANPVTEAQANRFASSHLSKWEVEVFIIDEEYPLDDHALLMIERVVAQ